MKVTGSVQQLWFVCRVCGADCFLWPIRRRAKTRAAVGCGHDVELAEHDGRRQRSCHEEEGGEASTVTSWRSHPWAKQWFFIPILSTENKKGLSWLGMVLCRRQKDEYRCTCVGCGLVCAVGAGSGRPGALGFWGYFNLYR
jgi:hypothetical protein